MKSVKTGTNPVRASFDGRVSRIAGQRRIPALVVASLCFLAPLLLLPYAQAAQPQAWQPLGLRGETVLALHVTSSDGQRLVYAETYTGLWRFMPGTDWRTIDGPLPRSRLGAPELAAWRVVPGRQSQLYALTGTGTARQLYRSTNAGDSWQIIGPAPGQTARPAMIVLPGTGNAPDTVILVTDSRVQRSSDGGASWSPGGPWPGQETAQTTQPTRVERLLADSSSPDRLFALTKEGQIWNSESGGLSWHTSKTPATGNPVSALAIAPYFGLRVWAATANDLLHSTDSGVTWRTHLLPTLSQAAPAGAQKGQITALLVDPRSPETLYAASAAGTIFRSEDSGDTWTNLDAAGGARVLALAIEPNTRDLLFAATHDGVWTRPVTPPPPQTLVTDAPIPDPLDEEEEIEFDGLTITPVATGTATATASPTALPTHTETPEPTAIATATATAPPSPIPSPTAPPIPTATAPPPPPTEAPPTATLPPPTPSEPPARPRPTAIAPTEPAPTAPPPATTAPVVTPPPR